MVFYSYRVTLPIIVFFVAVKLNGIVPANLAKQATHFFLNGRGDEARTITIFEVIRTAMVSDEILAHVRFYTTRHISIEDFRHAFGKSHFL